MRQMVVGVGEKIVRLRQVSHVYPNSPPSGEPLYTLYWTIAAVKSLQLLVIPRPVISPLFYHNQTTGGCKHRYIGVDVVPKRADSESSNIWNIFLASLEFPTTWQNR